MRGRIPINGVQRTLSVGSEATPFGCCNFFDSCTDGIFNLNFGGTLDLLDVLGFNPTDECYRSLEFITYRRPERQIDGVTPTVGYLSNPCADPNGVEMGTRKLTVEDFGLLGREGPTRDVRKGHVKYCKTRPLYRLDGQPLTSEKEWDMVTTMHVLLDDVRRMLITGNSGTAGQFDGLARWVSTNWGGMLNAAVVDWNGNPMAGGAGITLNGNAVPATLNFVDVLDDLFGKILQRIMWTPVLANQTKMLGDFILVMPTSWIKCLLDHYTCWSVCEGSQYNEVALQSFEARTFRNGLTAAVPENMFGSGFIRLRGFPIPILAYDWELINSPTLADIYFLTPSVGAQRLWEGEFLSAEAIRDEFGADMFAGEGYFSTDGGRVLGRVDSENLCYIMKLWMSLRLFNMAPWANIRFEDVQLCATAGGALSADPDETSFYPETSFDAAVCP